MGRLLYTGVNPVYAWFRIVRPPIVFISVLGSLVGTLNVTRPFGLDVDPMTMMLIGLGAALLAAGLMVHNDVTDLPSDKVNRPDKPLCVGAIGANTARITGIGLMVASIFVALVCGIGELDDSTLTPRGLNLPLAALTAIIVWVGIEYNVRGKLAGIWAHVMVAFGVGAIPYWGALAVRPDEPLMMLPLALAIFIMEIGREMMVCIGDLKGDMEAGWSTYPVRAGRDRSLKVSLAFYVGFLPIYPISYFGWLGFPRVFGNLYLIGGAVFFLILLVSWLDVSRVVRNGDEKMIWNAFERDIRTGTRAGVILFQFVLLAEAFAFAVV